MTTTEMNITIAEFCGFTHVKVGYVGVTDNRYVDAQTKWQLDNEEWLDKMGIGEIGEYLVNVEKDEYYQLRDAEYDKDYQLLIPAWFKCQAIIRVNPDYRKYDSLFYGAMRRESIEECHKVVYDFIVEWRSKEETKTL